MIPISFIQTLTKAFFEPDTLWQANEKLHKASKKIFVLLALIVGIPYFVAGYQSMQALGRDVEKVVERIPAFTIEDGELTFDEPTSQSVLLQTDGIAFLMDPQERLSSIEKSSARAQSVFSITFGKDSFVLQTGSYPFEISYKNAEGIDSKFFKDLLVNFGRINIVMLLSLLFGSFVGGAIELLIRLLVMTMAANLLSTLQRIRLPYSLNWRFMMITSVIPSLAFAIMNSIGLFPNGQLLFLVLASLFLYQKGVLDSIKKKEK